MPMDVDLFPMPPRTIVAYGVIYPADESAAGPFSLAAVQSHTAPGVAEALVAVFMETLLFGAFLIIAERCAVVLHRHRRLTGSYIYISSTFLLLAGLVTARFIVDVSRAIYAFTNPLDGGGIDLGSFKGPNTVVNNALLVSVVVISDIFLIFRCYMMWRDKLVLVGVPVLLTMATLGMGVYSVHQTSRLASDAPLDAGSQSLNAFLYFALGTNVACTFLVVFRMWLVQRKAQTQSRSSSSRSSSSHRGAVDFATVASESVFAYTILLAVEIATSATASFTSVVFANMICPTIGLVFSHLIIRVLKDSNIAGDVSRIYGRRSSQVLSGRLATGVRSVLPNEHEAQTQVRIQLETSVHRDTESRAQESTSKVNLSRPGTSDNSL